MDKLLVIGGPTATGKTKLAIHLAKKFNGEIVSADSRQVYQGLDIGTGKEWGKGVRIWGYDLVDPKDDYSVSRYVKFATQAIKDISSRGKLPILVGGTGFYIKALIDGVETIDVPPNKFLREGLKDKNIKDLFEDLSRIDSLKAGALNISDKKNPRRLIRAIEIAQWRNENPIAQSHKKLVFKTLLIGLYSDHSILKRNIQNRVDKQIKDGLLSEIRKLLRNGVSWKHQSMTSLGYEEWKEFFAGLKSKEDVIEKIKRNQTRYTSDQLTWFKKDPRIIWINISQPGSQKRVEKLVKKWYYYKDAEKD